jgi:carbon starvation protein
MLEEVIGTPETTVQEWGANKYVNAGIQCVIAYLLVSSGRWADLWPLFGGANQTLAALALLIATIWLANWDQSKQLISTGAPMAAMFVVTITALLYLAFYQNLYLKFVAGDPAALGTLGTVSAIVQIVIALVLVYLAVSLLRMGYANIREARSGEAVAADGGEPADD